MASIHTVFESVVDNGIEGKKVEVITGSKQDHETARTRLVALWNNHKKTLISIGGEDCDPLLPYSLCSDYDKESGVSTFYIGKPRRKVAKVYSFEVVGETSNSNEAPAIPSLTLDLPEDDDNFPANTSKLA